MEIVPERERPQPPPPLVQGSLKIHYGWEPFTQVLPAAKPLLLEHWAEIGTNKEAVPLDPDWDRYYAMDRLGQLWVWTARSGDGALVGYIVWIVVAGLHYVSTLWAITDIFWVHPGYREGRVGIKLFTSCEPALKNLGVKVMDVRVNDTFQRDAVTGQGRVGKIMTRALGCKLVDSTYRKLL